MTPQDEDPVGENAVDRQTWDGSLDRRVPKQEWEQQRHQSAYEVGSRDENPPLPEHRLERDRLLPADPQTSNFAGPSERRNTIQQPSLRPRNSPDDRPSRPATTGNYRPKRRRRRLKKMLTGLAVISPLLLLAVVAYNLQPDTDTSADVDVSLVVDSPDEESVAAPDSENADQTEVPAESDTTVQPGTTAQTDETVDVTEESSAEASTGTDSVRGLLTGDEVVLEGQVPSEQVAASLLELMEPLAGFGSVVNELEVNPSAPPVEDVSIIVDDEVIFAPGSDQISSQFFPTLNQMVAVMELSPDITVVVKGHTDSAGDEVQNLALSQRRAEAVVDYIAENNVNRFRLEPRGRGSGEPIDDNSTEAGRSRNRRIEFEVSGFNLIAE